LSRKLLQKTLVGGTYGPVHFKVPASSRGLPYDLEKKKNGRRESRRMTDGANDQETADLRRLRLYGPRPAYGWIIQILREGKYGLVFRERESAK